jgi:hypothetical protein
MLPHRYSPLQQSLFRIKLSVLVLFVDLLSGFKAVLVWTAFGFYATGLTTIVAYFVIQMSAVVSFENTTVFRSMIVQFAVNAGVSHIVLEILVFTGVSASKMTSAFLIASSIASTGEEC